MAVDVCQARNRLEVLRARRLAEDERLVCLERALILEAARDRHGHLPPVARQAAILRDLCEQVTPVVEPEDVLLGCVPQALPTEEQERFIAEHPDLLAEPGVPGLLDSLSTYTPDWDWLVERGLGGIADEVRQQLAAGLCTASDAAEQGEFLRAGDVLATLRSDAQPGTVTSLSSVVFSPCLDLHDLGNDATLRGKAPTSLKGCGRVLSVVREVRAAVLVRPPQRELADRRVGLDVPVEEEGVLPAALSLAGALVGLEAVADDHRPVLGGLELRQPEARSGGVEVVSPSGPVPMGHRAFECVPIRYVVRQDHGEVVIGRRARWTRRAVRGVLVVDERQGATVGDVHLHREAELMQIGLAVEEVHPPSDHHAAGEDEAAEDCYYPNDQQDLRQRETLTRRPNQRNRRLA
jgi:hypothetical protein